MARGDTRSQAWSAEPEFMSLRDAFASSPVQQAMAAGIAGARPMRDSDAKRHHFVPAMVLRNFASAKDRERIAQLDLTRGAPRLVQVQSAASRRNLYTFTDEDGTSHRRLEAWLAEVESHAATAIRCLVSDPTGLARADAATISYFIAMLLVRTPAATAAEFRREDQAMRIKLACQWADRVAFTAKAGRDETLRQRALQELRDGSIAYPDEKLVGLKAGFDRLGTDAQLIYQLRWTLLLAEGGAFVTSDRGVAMVDPQPPWPWTGNGLNSSPAAQTTVPLSTNACLLLEPANPRCSRQFRRVGRGDDEINLRTLGWADRHLFAGSQEALDRVRRQARSSPKLVRRPRPTRNVLVMPSGAGTEQFANANTRRGWPARVPVDGIPHDYRVLDADENPVDVCLEVWQAVARDGTAGIRLELLPRSDPPSLT